jgi:2-iminobutanoate/2-iminopropanoate deaminase
MITRLSNHYGDDTCSAYTAAGDFIFLAHHSGGHERDDIAYQMVQSFESLKRTLHDAGARLGDLVQINLYLRHMEHFSAARDIFRTYFDNEAFPARMTTTSKFVNPACLCMLDGIAYKPRG